MCQQKLAFCADHDMLIHTYVIMYCNYVIFSLPLQFFQGEQCCQNDNDNLERQSPV
jgi:hypothetical protein